MTPEVVRAKCSSLVVAQADSRKKANRTSVTFFMVSPPLSLLTIRKIKPRIFRTRGSIVAPVYEEKIRNNQA